MTNTANNINISCQYMSKACFH